MISMPRKVRHAVVNSLKPSIGRVRRWCLRRSLLIGGVSFTSEIVEETTGSPPVPLSNERDRRDGVRHARV